MNKNKFSLKNLLLSAVSIIVLMNMTLPSFAKKPTPWATCVRCNRVNTVALECGAPREKTEINAFLSDVTARLEQFTTDTTVTQIDLRKTLVFAYLECSQLDEFNVLLSVRTAEQVLRQFPHTPTRDEMNIFIQSLPESERSRRPAIEQSIHRLRERARILIADENTPEN